MGEPRAVARGEPVPAGYDYRQQEIGAPAESLARLLEEFLAR